MLHELTERVAFAVHHDVKNKDINLLQEKTDKAIREWLEEKALEFGDVLERPETFCENMGVEFAKRKLGIAEKSLEEKFDSHLAGSCLPVKQLDSGVVNMIAETMKARVKELAQIAEEHFKEDK